MKYFTLLILLFFISCSKYAEENTHAFLIPEGLKDCRFFTLRGEGTSVIRVVRCPNSSTTTNHRSGRYSNETTTIVEE